MGLIKEMPSDGFLLDQLLSSSLDAIYFKDLQSRFIMINQACAVKHGWTTPAEGIGKTDFDVFTDEHAEQAYADEQRIIATGESLCGIEEKETWPDGRITWVSTTKMPLRDEQGEVIGIFGITRDITHRKEAYLHVQTYIEEISAIKDSLVEDARMAGKLQSNLSHIQYPSFPTDTPPSESCVEFLHHFNMCQQVSGVYFSIKPLSDHEASIFLCDVYGTGVRAALGAALIRGIMQEIEGLGDNPTAFLGRLNQRMHPLLHTDKLALDVTACYLVLDATTGVARLASAGHPVPLLFRPGQPARWLFENLVLRGPALAVKPNSKYRTIECHLQPSDAVVMFTNGLFTLKNIQRRPFTERRLLGTAHRLVGKSLENIFQGLENEAISFSKAERFTEDVCLVGFNLRRLMERP